MDVLVMNVPDSDRAYQEKVWDAPVGRIWGVKEATAEKPLDWNDPARSEVAAEILTRYGGRKTVPPLDEVDDNRFVEAYHRGKR
jgi:hypothetical protein